MQSYTLLALAVRVLISLFTRTYFQPDEYFQSLEPAHHLVFGYGHLTWEWMASQPIRSIFYPLMNVPLFWVLKITRLSERGTLGDLLLVCMTFLVCHLNPDLPYPDLVPKGYPWVTCGLHRHLPGRVDKKNNRS
jgi:hypothetical protein